MSISAQNDVYCIDYQLVVSLSALWPGLVGEVTLVGKLFICTVGVVYWPDLQIYVEQYVSWSQCGVKMDWCYRIVLTRLPHLKNECCVWSGLRQSADLPINMEGFLARHCCTGPCRIQITQFRGVGNINRILSQERFLYDLVSWFIQPLLSMNYCPVYDVAQSLKCGLYY